MPSRLIDSLVITDEMGELFSDGSVLRAMLRFEVALARAQGRLGMIPGTAPDAIARAAVAEGFDPVAIARDARHSASVAIPLVRALTARVEAIDEEGAGFVHWGATSQDVVDTAMVLLLERARGAIAAHHARLASGLRELSDRHATTVMLARTLLQPAAPTTFGYKAAGWLGALRRSWRRLSRSFEEARRLQLGGAAGTLAAYGDAGPALAAELARELGLGLPEAPWHAYRDRLAGVVADCGIVAGSLGKVARDVALLMQAEVGEVAEPGGGSSALPTKRNPAQSVLVLAAATHVPGLVASFLAGMVQEHERAVGGWQAEWPIVAGAVQATGGAVASMAEVIEGLTVDAGRMRANIAATHGAAFAEKAAMLLAPALGRTTAQAVVAEAAKDRELREGLARHPRAVALLPPGQIEAIDRPEAYLGAAEAFRRRLLEEEG